MSSNFFRPETQPVARKQYVCIACGWRIPKGERHTAQTGVYEGRASSNRFHDECWAYLCSHLEGEDFTTGEVPVPERLRASE